MQDVWLLPKHTVFTLYPTSIRSQSHACGHNLPVELLWWWLFTISRLRQIFLPSVCESTIFACWSTGVLLYQSKSKLLRGDWRGALWFVASSNAGHLGRGHEGNRFKSCESVGKCYLTSSASIWSVRRRYERLWSFRRWFTQKRGDASPNQQGTAEEHWNISKRRHARTATFDHSGWRKTSETLGRNWNQWQCPL